uniref:BPTI/Kunitz inhibitor domain-containing protein n=1 Tax=Loa loa TaxID=7209 RepID=A0A1I7VUV8_LOALO
MKGEMEVSSESVSSANQMDPTTESVRTESTTHSSLIPNSPSQPSSVSAIESFPSSKTTIKLPSDIVIQVDPKIPEESFTVKTLPEVCWLPAVTGLCSKAKVLWYYNSLKGRCERFSSR